MTQLAADVRYGVRNLLNTPGSAMAAWWRPQVTLHERGQEPLSVNTIETSGKSACSR